MTVALPYRVASEAAVQAGAWLLHRGETLIPAPTLLPEWDCGTDLQFSREIVIDLDALEHETGLPVDTAPLALIVQWRVTGSLLRGIAFRGDVTRASTSTQVDFALSGRSLGGTLQLDTSLILTARLSSHAGPTATHAGSVLWADRPKKIRLTGEASRLPIAVVEFARHRLDPSAPWAVVIDGSLDSPAMGAVQLLLNSKRQDVVDLVQGHGDAAVARAVRSALYVAVGRALVEHALLEEELTDDARFDEDTLGSVLLGVVRTRFNRSLEDLRRIRNQEPSEFNALIDGRFGLLRDATA